MTPPIVIPLAGIVRDLVQEAGRLSYAELWDLLTESGVNLEPGELSSCLHKLASTGKLTRTKGRKTTRGAGRSMVWMYEWPDSKK